MTVDDSSPEGTLFVSKNFKLKRQFLDSLEGTGGSRIYEYIEQPEVVIAVPVLADSTVVLVRHHRPILGVDLLECPGGKVDPGESRADAVKRELREEIGFTPGHLLELGSFFTSVGTSTERIAFFLASDMAPAARAQADRKKMDLVRVTPEEIRAMLVGQVFSDAKTHIALTYLFGSPDRSELISG